MQRSICVLFNTGKTHLNDRVAGVTLRLNEKRSSEMVKNVLFEVVLRLIIEIMNHWEQWWPLVPTLF